MRIVEVERGSPSQRSDLLPGDQIVAINGMPTAGVSHDALLSNMQGALGTRIDLVISRDSKQYSVSMTRAADWRMTRNDKPPTTFVQPAIQPVEQVIPENSDELDNRLISVKEHTPNTDQVYRSVVRGLAFLPKSIKQFFVANGVTVAITPTAEELGIPAAGSEYDIANKRVIICERNPDGTTSDISRLDITTLHELGHAFDRLHGYPSGDDEFQQAYSLEAPLVPQKYRKILSHFLQPGLHGPRECFASLFACKYYRGNDARLTALKASFPKTFALVDHVKE